MKNNGHKDLIWGIGSHKYRNTQFACRIPGCVQNPVRGFRTYARNPIYFADQTEKSGKFPLSIRIRAAHSNAPNFIHQTPSFQKVKKMTGPVGRFMEENYLHFNAASVVDASRAYKKLVESDGKMMVTLAGAMSTAELGKSLAEMIRKGKVHAIACTGANLEEDLFNLVAHDNYVRVSNYRQLSTEDEKKLYDRGLNRVTDTCIPEEEAMRRLEQHVLELWKDADKKKESCLPHAYLYRLLNEGTLKKYYQIDPINSWMVAAAEMNLPLFVPGWEDSTLGNMFVSQVIKKNITNMGVVKSGLHYMMNLVEWYSTTSKKHNLGFFQIGGGIAGDFPICVVPLLGQDLKKKVPFWSYFCQISDSTTSFGSYSGAVPNEKITWGKLDADTPRFVIESDATIVAPLVFAYVLGW